MPIKEITHLLQQNLIALIRHQHLFSPHEKLVVGVSGGTDSLALAHILTNLRQRLQLEIHIATFNHGLRPEAHAETQFVAKIAQQFNIPYTVGQGDVWAVQSARKLTLEEAARQTRYEFLAQVAHDIGAKTIVTAHHQDDQAETILFQLVRGTGDVLGMRWISPCPYAPDLRLVRPLLTTSRQHLEAYCIENGLTPVHDPSNDDMTITRNAIRHDIMPLLAKINPQVASALGRFAQIHADAQDALHQQFVNTILPHIKQENSTFYIPRALFRTWHVAYQRHLFTHLLNIPNITYDHITHAIHIGMTGAQGAIAQFPQGWQLRVMYDQLVLEQVTLSSSLPTHIPLLPSDSDINIQIDEQYDFGHWRLSIRSHADEPTVIPLMIPHRASITLRTRQPKDKFAPLGMNGKHQTIKNWMINHKIPQALRAHIPLLLVDDTIACIFWDGVHLSDMFRDSTYPNIQSIFISILSKKTG